MSIRTVGATIVAVLVLAVATNAPAWDFNVEMDLGQIFFEEDLTLKHTYKWQETTIASDLDWQSFFGRLRLTAGDYDWDWIDGGVEYSLLFTETESHRPSVTEEVFEFGSLVSEDKFQVQDDVDLIGLELHLEAGSCLELTQDIHCAGLVGYGFRHLNFDTTIDQTTFFEKSGSSFEYDVHYLDLIGRLRWIILPEALDVVVEGAFGPVLASRRSDEELGSIRGHGGWIWSIEGKVAYQIRDNIAVSAGVFYEHQELNGASDTDTFQPFDQTIDLDWDNHHVETVGGTLGVDFIF